MRVALLGRGIKCCSVTLGRLILPTEPTPGLIVRCAVPAKHTGNRSERLCARDPGLVCTAVRRGGGAVVELGRQVRPGPRPLLPENVRRAQGSAGTRPLQSCWTPCSGRTSLFRWRTALKNLIHPFFRPVVFGDLP